MYKTDKPLVQTTAPELVRGCLSGSELEVTTACLKAERIDFV